MSQAEFNKRWCLTNAIAGAEVLEVSSDAYGSAAVQVRVPTLAAVTVPVALVRVLVLYLDLY